MNSDDNKHLLKTIIVKSNIKQWLEEEKDLEEISWKLFYIHKIRITDEELIDFIKENKIVVTD